MNHWCSGTRWKLTACALSFWCTWAKIHLLKSQGKEIDFSVVGQLCVCESLGSWVALKTALGFYQFLLEAFLRISSAELKKLWLCLVKINPMWQYDVAIWTRWTLLLLLTRHFCGSVISQQTSNGSFCGLCHQLFVFHGPLWLSDGVFYMKNLCHQVCNRVRVVSGSCFDSIYLLMCNMSFFCTIKMVWFILCLLLGEFEWYSQGTDLCLVAMLPQWKSAGKGRADCFDLILKCQWLSDGSFMEALCSRQKDWIKITSLGSTLSAGSFKS